MYKIHLDSSKNRIYGTLEGAMDLNEAKRYTQELKKAVDMAKLNFTAVFDLSKLGVVASDCMEEVQSGKQYAVKKGVKKSAIVLSSALLKIQSKKNLGHISNGSTEEYFDSLKEAEAFLDK